MRKRQKLDGTQKQELECFIKDKNHSSKEIRKAQVVLMLDTGLALAMIENVTRYSRRQCFDIRKRYITQGLAAIEDKARKNPKELLNKKQKSELTQIIQSKTPEDFGYHADYWLTGIVADLIWRRYQIRYKSKTSIYIIFKQAKFSYHKPDRRYQARNEHEVEHWKKQAKIKLEQSFTEPDTITLVADEMSLSTQTTIQKIWLPQGEYPKIEVAAKRQSRSIYGFLNIKDGREHAFKTDWQNMYITYEVLGKLREVYPYQKLLLFWDKAPWHKGSRAQQFIKEDGNIETFDFPRAAPEENPQEHVWKSGRSTVSHNRFIDDIDEAANEFVEYLNKTTFNYSFLGFSAG